MNNSLLSVCVLLVLLVCTYEVISGETVKGSVPLNSGTFDKVKY